MPAWSTRASLSIGNWQQVQRRKWGICRIARSPRYNLNLASRNGALLILPRTRRIVASARFPARPRRREPGETTGQDLPGYEVGVLSQTLVGSNCWIAGTYTALCTKLEW
jgi:hypothetical protein